MRSVYAVYFLIFIIYIRVIQSSKLPDKTVVPALVISGKQSWRNDASIEARAELQTCGKEVTLLEPSPCYLLPLEEASKKSAISMMLFIQSKNS